MTTTYQPKIYEIVDAIEWSFDNSRIEGTEIIMPLNYSKFTKEACDSAKIFFGIWQSFSLEMMILGEKYDSGRNG